MLPCELQEVILGFKKQREEKAVRLEQLKADVNSLNAELRSKKLTLQKQSAVIVAIGFADAAIQLESSHYGNPKEELGNMGYTLVLSKLTEPMYSSPYDRLLGTQFKDLLMSCSKTY